MCPWCSAADDQIIKRGSFPTKSGRDRQRFSCKTCRRTFSERTGCLNYRLKKPRINQKVFRLLARAMAQRDIADELMISKDTVAHRVKLLSKYSRLQRHRENASLKKAQKLCFDEMEAFVHTRCKPVSMVIVVEENTRRILSVRVAKMPAKGRLAKVSRKKYGPRPDHRPSTIGLGLQQASILSCSPLLLIKSDQNQMYRRPVRDRFPGVIHDASKGRKPIVAGYGEMKEGGWDPLFSINHTCAMFRAKTKTLSRRSWCTSKKLQRLQDRMDIYSCFHNQKLRGIRPRLDSGLRTAI